jgi:hypothetical protein
MIWKVRQMVYRWRYAITESKAQREGEGGRGIALHSLDLGARRGWVVSTTPRPLYPRERPGTHCTEGWVGHRAGLDLYEKSPLLGFDPRTVQSLVSRYTDWAIPAPTWHIVTLHVWIKTIRWWDADVTRMQYVVRYIQSKRQKNNQLITKWTPVMLKSHVAARFLTHQSNHNDIRINLTQLVVATRGAVSECASLTTRPIATTHNTRGDRRKWQ